MELISLEVIPINAISAWVIPNQSVLPLYVVNDHGIKYFVAKFYNGNQMNCVNYTKFSVRKLFLKSLSY